MPAVVCMPSVRDGGFVCLSRVGDLGSFTDFDYDQWKNTSPSLLLPGIIWFGDKWNGRCSSDDDSLTAYRRGARP